MKVSMKALRVNAELSQADAAKKIGVNPMTLSSWEAHTTFPTLDQLVTMCRIYGCTVDDVRLPDNIANSDNEAD